MVALRNGELVQYCGVTENLGGSWRPGRWPEPDIRYCIRDQHPLVAAGIWEGEIAWALAQWSKLFELNFERIDEPRRAHFLFTVGNLGGPGGVLAQAQLVPYGVQRNDDFQSKIEVDSFDKFGAEDRSMVAMQFDLGETLCHEAGHSLGMMHDESREVALLDPNYNPTISGPQERDIAMMLALGYPLRKAKQPAPKPEPTPSLGPIGTRSLRAGQTYTAKKRAWLLEEL